MLNSSIHAIHNRSTLIKDCAVVGLMHLPLFKPSFGHPPEQTSHGLDGSYPPLNSFLRLQETLHVCPGVQASEHLMQCASVARAGEKQKGSCFFPLCTPETHCLDQLVRPGPLACIQVPALPHTGSPSGLAASGCGALGAQRYANPAMLLVKRLTSSASCQVTPECVCQNFLSVAACRAALACCAFAFTR